MNEDKLTFIILSRSLDENEPVSLPESLGELLPTDERLARLPMIGDVNLFLYGTPPSHAENESQDAEENTELEDEFYAEVEIMIAGVFRSICLICAHLRCFL